MGREADTSGYTEVEVEHWEKVKACQETVFHTKKGLEYQDTNQRKRAVRG